MDDALPADVSALLEALTANLPSILGESLVGLYLYGSLTQQAFDPEHSDIDCIVVTHRDLTDTQFSHLDAWLAQMATANPWMARLQMTMLIRDEVLTMNAKACHYQFGRLKRGGSDGNPIIWVNVLASGVVLYGVPPATFVPPITDAVFFEALVREIGYLREEISENPESEWRDVPYYRAYAVLTVCRILYSSRKGGVVSKPEAARWAIDTLPEAWHGLIRQALKADYATLSTAAALAQVAAFITFAEGQLPH